MKKTLFAALLLLGVSIIISSCERTKEKEDNSTTGILKGSWVCEGYLNGELAEKWSFITNGEITEYIEFTKDGNYIEMYLDDGTEDYDLYATFEDGTLYTPSSAKWKPSGASGYRIVETEEESYLVIGQWFDLGEGDLVKIINKDKFSWGERNYLRIKKFSASTTPSVHIETLSITPTSLVLVEGGSTTLKGTVYPSFADMQFSWSSSDPSIATVDQSGRVTAVKDGVATITVTCDKENADCSVRVLKQISSQEAVDLGLSVKWASCNLRANSPEKAGGHYAWGEIETKSKYDWDTYKWAEGHLPNSTYYPRLTKYNSIISDGNVDGRTQLEFSDDAAQMVLGDKWRMPTKMEYQELLYECEQYKTTYNGKNGWLFLSKKAGHEDKWIFFPEDMYWSSSVGSTYASHTCHWAYCMRNNSDDGYCMVYSHERHNGFAVRPVYDDDITHVESISLNPSSISLSVGKSTDITAEFIPSNATDQNLTWDSSDEAVVTVSNNGYITGKSCGIATITATTVDGGKTATCKVTVTQWVTSISLDNTSLDLAVGDTYELVTTIEPSNASIKNLDWEIDNSSVVTVNNGLVRALAKGKATITVSAKDGSGVSVTCSVIVSNPCPTGAVDMGTHTSEGYKVYWATSNLSTSGLCANETDYGDYYAWGEIIPYYTEGHSQDWNCSDWRDRPEHPITGYNWASYKWCNGTLRSLTKYNTDSSLGDVDNRKVLDPEDDVAHVRLGGGWRIPTADEWTELSTKCTWEWTANYNGTGVKGRIVTGTNGNSIFLPAAGIRFNARLGYGPTNATPSAIWGHYWSSRVYVDTYRARQYCFNCYDGSVSHNERALGMSIRPVCEE